MRKFVQVTIIFTIIACQPAKKKEDTGILNGGGNIAVPTGNTVVNGTSIFAYVVSNLTQRYGTVSVTPSLPADGSPVINSASAITTLTAPALPADQSYSVPQASYVFPSVTPPTKLNITFSTLGHTMYMNESVSACSYSLASGCSVDTLDDKKLTLVNIDTTQLASSTTSLAVTMDSKTVSVPARRHTLTLSMDNEPSSGSNQYAFNQITGAVFIGNYFYYVGRVVISGSNYEALFRVHKTTYDTELVYNPTQSLVTGGNISNIVAFNGKVYFGAKPNGYSDYRFLVYDPGTSSLTQLSSSSDLLNPGKFLVYGSSLYFTANSTGLGARLYKMSTTHSFKKLTDLCGTSGDVGYKYLTSAIGIYVSLSDPAACSSDRIIVRIKPDDSMISLAYYRPGANDPTNDGLGAVATQGGNYYFSAGNDYYLYKDNNDGTITNLVGRIGFGITGVPVKNFVADSRGIFWIRDDYSTVVPMHYDIATGNIQRLYYGSNTYFRDDIMKIGDAVVFPSAFSTNSFRYQVVSDEFYYREFANINGMSDDKITSLGTYQNEQYFYARTNIGTKLWKYSSDKKFLQLTNLNTSGHDFSQNGSNIFLTEGGIIFSHPSGGSGMLVFQ